jgi:hypothetical protein
MTCASRAPSRLRCHSLAQPIRAGCTARRIPRQSHLTKALPKVIAAVSATTAKDAVELGLQQFAAGETQAALGLFLEAQRLRPTEEEACAAAYNAACCYTRLQRWSEAADAVVSAVNDHGLKLSVALADKDLAPLRETREWTAALESASGGISSSAFVKLRAEAKAPFRLTRIIFVGGLSAGAVLGLLISSARLVGAVGGAEGAPEVWETLRTCAINAGALGALSFLLWRDLGAQRRDEAVATREEALAQLRVRRAPTVHAAHCVEAKPCCILLAGRCVSRFYGSGRCSCDCSRIWAHAKTRPQLPCRLP